MHTPHSLRAKGGEAKSAAAPVFENQLTLS